MPRWALLLLFLLPTALTLSYKCENNQVLVVQSFGNDTIRMHCQRLDLCGYQQLKCEYDKMQPHCGGKTNFVAHVSQNTPTGLVEHTCCQLYNPNPPNHVPTHDGNDCFIYELPDGSTHPEGEVLQPLTPLNAEDKPLTILKSAAEIPSQIDGYSGYRLRLFLLRNKSPPTLLVKGIERRIDGYRVTICRPRCGNLPITGNGWRGVSWNSWSASSWSSWAKTVWGNAEHEEAEKRERVRQREGQITGNNGSATASASAAAAAAAAATAGGNNGNAGLSGETGKSGASGSAAASGVASSGSSSETGQGGQAASSASTAVKAESGNSNPNGNNGTGEIHIHIHTDGEDKQKNNGTGNGKGEVPLIKGIETGNSSNSGTTGNENGSETKSETPKPITATSESFNGNGSNGKTTSGGLSEVTPKPSGESGEPTGPIDPTTPNGKGLKKEQENKQTETGNTEKPTNTNSTTSKDKNDEEKNKNGSNGETTPTIGIDGGEGTETEPNNGKRPRIIEGRQGPGEDETEKNKENNGQGKGGDEDDGVKENGQTGPGNQNGEKTEKSAEVNGRTETEDFSTEVTETKGDEKGNDENEVIETSEGDGDEIDGNDDEEEEGEGDGGDEGDEGEPMHPDEDGSSETDLNNIIGKKHKEDSENESPSKKPKEQNGGDEKKNGNQSFIVEPTEPSNPNENNSEAIKETKKENSENEKEEYVDPDENTPLNENEAKDDIIEKKKKRLAKAKSRAKAKKEAAKRRRKLQAARQEAQRRHNKGQFRTITATAEKESSAVLEAAPRLLADPPAAAAARNCFAADSIVSTSRGPRRMDELQVGDRVLVPSANGVPKFEMIEMFYHRIPDRRTNFILLETANGHKLSVTALHLLPFGDCLEMEKLLNQSEGIDSALHGSRFAHRARIGDCLLTTNGDGEIKTEEIIKIGRRISTGIYSPITVEGSIIVDGVLASCFAQVESHATHKVLYDFTHWVYKTFSITATSSEWSEVFPLPRLVHYMHELSRHVLPFSKH